MGITGSIGQNCLDILQRFPERFTCKALVAHRDAAGLATAARTLNPEMVALHDSTLEATLCAHLEGWTGTVMTGAEAVRTAAAEAADVTVAAITGIAGLEPTLAAVHRGGIIALANKECLVAAGDVFMAAVAQAGATLIPVDSEHNAIHQILTAHSSPRRLILTASGGPFRLWPQEAMEAITPEQALAHPTWSMGEKITIDSATLMNKGLEVIEAHHLFGPAPIDVVVHPQSVVHSMVEYTDGSMVAQLGAQDMRLPLAYALAWPERLVAPGRFLDLATAGPLEFFEPDTARFPLLRRAIEALEAEDGSTLVLNAANEVAVRAFLDRRIGFGDIARIVNQTLDSHPAQRPDSLAEIMAADRAARRCAEALVAQQ